MVKRDNNMHSTIIRKKTSILVYVLIFIYLLMTMRCWIGFEGRKFIFTYVFFVFMALAGVFKLVNYQFKTKYVFFFLIVFLWLLYSIHFQFNLFGFINQLVIASNILFVVCIPDADKDDLLHKMISWFGLLMIFSLAVFFLLQFFSLPSLGTIQSDYGSEEALGPLFQNYIFYIKPIDIEGHTINLDFYRFNGPFIEPGDIGCVTGFMLMAAKFDFKHYKYLWGVLAVLLVSLSLAGYVIAGLGYFFCLYSQNRMSMRNIVIITLGLIGIYLFATYSNNGDNVLNNAILSRLESDEDKGFSGNDRSSLVMDAYFISMFNNPRILLLGYDADTVAMIKEGMPGAGFVSEVLGTGLIGFIGLCIPYLYFALKSKNRRYAMLFFILFLFFMYQRTDALWIAYILCFVYGIVVDEQKKLLTV